MAFVSGTWDAAALNTVKVEAARMWNQDVWQKQYKRVTGIWNDLITNQTLSASDPSVMDLLDGTTCRAITVYWMQDKAAPSTTACGTAYEGTANDCDFDGPELGADSKSYSTACLAVSRRKIIDKNCKDEFDTTQKTARALMNIKKDLEFELENKLISFIEGEKKTNPLETADWTGTIAGDTWTINKADVKPEFIAELKEAAEILKMVNPVIVSGRTWYQDKLIANAEQGGGCCNLYSLLSQENGFQNTHNIVDLDTLAGGTAFYLVDLATIGFVPEARYSNPTPQSKVANLTFWRDSTMNLQWRNGTNVPTTIPVDMRRLVKCVGQSDYSFVYEGKISGLFASSPANDGTDYPNVLKFLVV